MKRDTSFPISCVLFLLAWTAILPADQLKAQQKADILISEVLLYDPDGPSEDRQVNILISDSILRIVTMDEVPLVEGMTVYGGQGGYVFGDLGIGERASFLILDQDPRGNLEVLLDTKSHLLFAIHKGEIVANSLTALLGPEENAEAKPDTSRKTQRKSRLAYYIPPPMALPLNYQDNTKWNRWETRPFSGIFVAAVAMDRHSWLSQDNNSEQQVGDLRDFDGGEIRAFRFGIAGTLNFKRPWVYTLMAATHVFDQGYNSRDDGLPTLLDYRLDIPVFKTIALSIGKQKEPISMERLLLGTQLPMQERPAVVDAQFPFRNVGIAFSGSGFNERMTWAVGVYNDWFDASQNFGSSSNQVIGRVTGLAYVSDKERQLIHLGLGLRYDDAREELNFRSRPEFGRSPLFVETGPLKADGAILYDMELSWRGGPFWVSTELIRNHIRSSDLGTPVLGGYHISGTWVITREMRKYNRRNGTMGPVPVSRSLYQGGPGAWELAGRFSSIDLNEGSVEGGEMAIFSFGLNW
jgi:phosphate-selective porin OprO/OprP